MEETATKQNAQRVLGVLEFGGLGPHLKILRRSRKKPQDQTSKTQLLQELLHGILTKNSASNHRQPTRKRASGRGQKILAIRRMSALHNGYESAAHVASR